MRSSERRFLQSSLAAYGSQIGRTLIRAAGDLALARLILPADHGLFALALGIVVTAGIVRDLGLPYQLVRDEDRPYGAVFLWVTGAGVAAAALLVLGAPLAGGLDPRLPAVLRLFSIFVVLDGLAVVPRIFFERELEVRRLVAPEIARGLAMAGVSIALALAGWGVWALVAGQLAAAALFAGLLWRRAWGRMPLAGAVDRIPGLIGRSIFLFLIALAVLPMPYVAQLILAATLGPALGAFWVGQYGKARDWGFRLQELVLPAVARVLYPALITYRGERRRFLGAYRMGTVTIAALQTLAAYVLYFNAEIVLLRILIGRNWAPAVPLLRILCFVPLTDPFSPLGGELLKAEEQDRGWLAIVLVNLGSLVLFGTLLAGRYGAAGLAWANYLLLGNLLMARRVQRICGREFWPLVRDLLGIYLTPLPLFLAVTWIFPAASWARFAASLAAAALALGLYALRFHRPFRGFFAAAPGSVEAGTLGLSGAVTPTSVPGLLDAPGPSGTPGAPRAASPNAPSDTA